MVEKNVPTLRIGAKGTTAAFQTIALSMAIDEFEDDFNFNLDDFV